jgi:hypothetical protein
MSSMSENMPTKNFRCDEESWSGAMQRAAEDGVNLSALIREWVKDYAAGRKRTGPGRPATVEVSRAELTKLGELIGKILN